MRKRLPLLLLLLLGGCASAMPYTARTIAPATMTDLWISMAADVEQWLIYLGI